MKKILMTLTLLIVGIIGFSTQAHAEGEEPHADVWRLNFGEVFDAYLHISLFTYEDLESEDIEPLYYAIYNAVWRIHDISTNYDNPYIYPLPGQTRDERKDDVETREARVSIRDINENPNVAHEVDPWLIEMLDLGIDIYNDPATNQRFNIAQGALFSVWKTYTDRCNMDQICELPSEEELEAADQVNDPNLIDIDRVAQTVTIPEGMKLDLGGLAKGFAAQVVGDLLRDTPFVDAFLVDAGASSIEVFGDRPNVFEGLWRIGLTEPEAFGRILVPGGHTIGTSSGFQRYFRIQGDDTRYHHLIDPSTRFPAQFMQTVTVLSPDTMMVDLYKSIAFLMPLDDSIAFINSLDNVEALWVDNDGDVHLSDGFEDIYTLEFYDNEETSLWIYALGGLSALMILAVAGYFVATALRPNKDDEVDYTTGESDKQDPAEPKNTSS